MREPVAVISTLYVLFAAVAIFLGNETLKDHKNLSDRGRSFLALLMGIGWPIILAGLVVVGVFGLLGGLVLWISSAAVWATRAMSGAPDAFRYVWAMRPRKKLNSESIPEAKVISK